MSLAFVSTRGVTRWGHPAGFIDFYAQHLIAGEKVFGNGGGGGGGGGGGVCVVYVCEGDRGV